MLNIISYVVVIMTFITKNNFVLDIITPINQDIDGYPRVFEIVLCKLEINYKKNDSVHSQSKKKRRSKK